MTVTYFYLCSHVTSYPPSCSQGGVHQCAEPHRYLYIHTARQSPRMADFYSVHLLPFLGATLATTASTVSKSAVSSSRKEWAVPSHTLSHREFFTPLDPHLGGCISSPFWCLSKWGAGQKDQLQLAYKLQILKLMSV